MAEEKLSASKMLKAKIATHGSKNSNALYFTVEELQHWIWLNETIETERDEARRLLSEAQHYVSHANYDLYLAIQIDEFLTSPKIIES